MFGPAGASSYTQAVIDLRNIIHSNTTVKDSLYEQAAAFFNTFEADKQRIAALREVCQDAKKEAESASWRKGKEKNATLEKAEKKLVDALEELEKKRLKRLNSVIEVCQRLIKLTEADRADDTALNSAKLLGTVLLCSPGEGKRLADLHNRSKPMYKATLAARLLDKLLKSGNITNKYIHRHYKADKRFAEKAGDLSEFQEEVVVPVLMAAIFQDVGMYHPDARLLLKGEEGNKNEFRLLEGSERVELLKINHTRTLEYVTEGLGCLKYTGDSKAERDAFDKQQKDKLIFLRTMLNDAIKPMQGLGNLIKAPQIYTSVILSTKTEYDIRELPKAALLLEQIAKKGVISEEAAKHMVNTVGYFPQGYGIAYIPKDDLGRDQDRYEYAVVNGLDPSHPKKPNCRIVTRNLEFISYGTNAQVTPESNLYFPTARKKLQKVSKERLREIIEKLYHDFEQRGEAELIPKCWQPYDYFSFKNNQNLWNRKISVSI